MLQKNQRKTLCSVSTEDKGAEELLEKEWLLTNGIGGYASSTVMGCNTRKYHGLLVGSLTPPIGRMVGLSCCLEMLILGGRVFNLSTFEFDDKFAPEGYKYLKRFYQDCGVHFEYEIGRTKLRKSVYLRQDANLCAVVYDFRQVKEAFEFAVRPFTSLRDYHTVQKSYASLCCRYSEAGLLIRHDVPISCELLLACEGANFEKDEQWWFNFNYRRDKERGEDYKEDLWAPGFFRSRVEGNSQVVIWAQLRKGESQNGDTAVARPSGGVESLRQELQERQRRIVKDAKFKDERLKTLSIAADKFVCKLPLGGNGANASGYGQQVQPDGHSSGKSYPQRVTILAGLPWFADWGRDAMISLRGLLLLTGRTEEARDVLMSFSQAVDAGIIPNRFDERSGTADFNSIDASLWFIEAAFDYLEATEDFHNFTQEFLPVIRWIVDCYQSGTRFNIRADEDGLITGGFENSQLTWMDAKCGGVPFNCRQGKAVEVNALWYDCLYRLGQFYAGRDVEIARRFDSMAIKAGKAFCEVFWNGEKGYLNDCVAPDGEVDSSLRPNQIFAVSLKNSALSPQQQRLVLEVVERELLTPYGLRSLGTSEADYKGIYNGSLQQRDGVYHQGTVWPYLLGAFVEAYLKVHGRNKKARKQVGEFIKPLLEHTQDGRCIGQLGEIFDGDAPYKARGCIAQAWSVGELIRAYHLANS